MKKISLLILVIFFSFSTTANAKDKLMICTYDAKTSDETYLRYRVTYYDDETITKEIVNGNDRTKFYESNGKLHSNVSIFKTKDNTFFSSILTVGDYFAADNMKKYYEKKVCPYLGYYYGDPTNSFISPQEDTSLNGTAYSYYVSSGNTELFDGEGKEEKPNIPVVTQSCDYHITSDKSIPNVEGFTMNFSMYNDGKKYFKVYFNKDGASSAQNIQVTNTGAVGRLKTDKGHTYTIVLPPEEVSNIFEQKNMAQVNNNSFACPSNDSIFLIEESYTEGNYKLTTNAKEAGEYNYGSNLEEGEGKEGEGNDKEGNVNVNISLGFDDDGYCESYLGNPTSKNSPAYYLQFVFNLMKYAAIVILFIMTVVEFVKAVPSNNQDAIKKALNNTIKRLMIAIIIFFLPLLIEFLLTVLGVYSPGTCGIK